MNPNIALTAIIVILAFSIPLAFLINWQFGLITLFYFVTQIAYTFLLKHMVIIDVMIVASGFVIRAMAGALAIEVPISPWLYVCVTLLALFQAISKRRHELISADRGDRQLPQDPGGVFARLPRSDDLDGHGVHGDGLCALYLHRR